MSTTERTGDAPVPPEPAAEGLARIAARDETGLADLYDRYAGLVYSLALRLGGEVAAAETVTEEVFLAVWRHPDRFDPTRGTVETWLLTMAHRRAVDAARRWRIALPPAGDAEPGTPRTRRIRALLDGLPAGQARLVELAYDGGYTVDEIAGIVSVPVAAVTGGLAAAMARLREGLAEDG